MPPATNQNSNPPLSKSARKRQKQRQKKREHKKVAAAMPSGSSSEATLAPVGKITTPTLPPSPSSSNECNSTSSGNLTSPLDSEEEYRFAKSLAKPLIPIRANGPWSKMPAAKTDIHNLTNDAFAAKSKPTNPWGTQDGKSVASKLFPGAKKPVSSSASPPLNYDAWDGATRAVIFPDDPSVPSSALPFKKPMPEEWIVTPDTEEQKDKQALDMAMEKWPYYDDPSELKMIAPWVESGHGWKSRKFDNKTQSPLFFKLFSVDVIRHEILARVFQSLNGMDAFARLCQDSFNFGVAYTHIWDMTHGDFQHCELPRIPTYEMIKSPDLAKKPQGTVRPVIVVTPIRTGKEPASYVDQILNLRKMCVASNNFADHIKNIQFHRVPFLTVQTLEILVLKMWKLEFLGVYNCQMINIGHLMNLLWIIEQHAEEVVFQTQLRNPHAPIRKRWATLDFFPMFHIGPVHVAGENHKYAGSYGCTWDNHGIDSRQSIWSIIYRALPQAKAKGIDLVGEGTALRKWLRKGPCLLVDEVLKRMLNPKVEVDELLAWIRYDKFRGKAKRLYIHQAFPSKQGWANRLIRCVDCKSYQMAIFFHCNYIRSIQNRQQLAGHSECAGCLLTSKLHKEVDHYKDEKRRILNRWNRLGKDENGKQLYIRDVPTLLEAFDDKSIEHLARSLDLKRQRDIADDARGGYEWDHELAERQIPITEKERNQKVGFRWRSPDIYQTVDQACEDRLDGHGVQW